jgi:hypothetical protein
MVKKQLRDNGLAASLRGDNTVWVFPVFLSFIHSFSHSFRFATKKRDFP